MIGVDLGTYSSIAADFTTQGIEIILSDSSATSTPSYIGYTPQDRLIG